MNRLKKTMTLLNVTGVFLAAFSFANCGMDDEFGESSSLRNELYIVGDIYEPNDISSAATVMQHCDSDYSDMFNLRYCISNVFLDGNDVDYFSFTVPNYCSNLATICVKQRKVGRARMGYNLRRESFGVEGDSHVTEGTWLTTGCKVIELYENNWFPYNIIYLSFFIENKLAGSISYDISIAIDCDWL